MDLDTLQFKQKILSDLINQYYYNSNPTKMDKVRTYLEACEQEMARLKRKEVT